MNYIYEITNKTNGKKYVGQTNDPVARKAKHFSDSHNKALSKDIKTLGIDQFEFEVIDETEDPIMCNYKEINAIEESSDKNVYNFAPGGQLVGIFDSFVCGDCESVKELRHINLVDKEVGMIFFAVSGGEISRMVLLCHNCRTCEGYPHPVAMNTEDYPRSLNLTANALMDLVMSYNIPDRLVNKLMIVNGKMNARMAYAYFTKRLGYT